MKRFAAILMLTGASLTCVAGGSMPPPPTAVKFLGLFDQLRAAELQKNARTHSQVSFRLSEAEINDYMKYALTATPRPGVQSVTVKLFPNNYVSTFTVVDFDAVERWRPGTVPALLKPVLNGKKSVWVDYRFQANNAKLTFSVEKAYYQNVRLPAFLVEKMIQIVAARQPEKYDTTKPVPLPFGLRDLWTGEHLIAGRN